MTTETKTRPAGRILKCERDLRHDFSKDEMIALAQEQAQKNNELQETLDRKKEVVSDYKAKTDMLEGSLNLLARKVSNGYEFRSIPCEVRMHDPEEGKKSTYRMDSIPPELVKVEDMSLIEKQEELELLEAEDKAAETEKSSDEEESPERTEED